MTKNKEHVESCNCKDQSHTYCNSHACKRISSQHFAVITLTLPAQLEINLSSYAYIKLT